MYNFKVNNTELKTTSDFLNGLVHAYREGTEGAAEALIEAFEPLLNKYFILLMDGVWSIDDRDVVSFLTMMSYDGDLEKTAAGIRRSIQRLYTPEDIRQELILVLLLTAQNYNNISKNYKFELKKRAQDHLLKDAPIQDKVVIYDFDPDTVRALSPGGVEIDDDWVVGKTAGHGFERLTSLQRAIIKYRYYDGLSVAVAAKKLKMSPRQLQRHNRVAKQILEDYFNAPKDER